MTESKNMIIVIVRSWGGLIFLLLSISHIQNSTEKDFENLNSLLRLYFSHVYSPKTKQVTVSGAVFFGENGQS